MNLSGVLVALCTPFTEQGEVAFEEFERHLNFLVEGGVSGFVPCGTTGEGSTLRSSEREKLIHLCVKLARGRVLKVIAGCGTNDTESTIANVLSAHNLGAHAALIVTPYYNKPTQRGLLAHYHKVAEASPIPLILYNVPTRTGVNLSPDTAIELFEHPRIIGIKEASGESSQWLELSRRMDLSRRFLLAGDDDAFATVLGLGGHGTISAAANVIPEWMVKIEKAFAEKREASGFDLQKKLQPMIRALFLETNPAPAKAALRYLGQYSTDFVRLPLVTVTEETRRTVIQELKKLQ